MKLTELDVIRRSLNQEMAQELITTSRSIAAEEASFALSQAGAGAEVVAVSAAERGILRIRMDVAASPQALQIEFVPWKSARVAVNHAVTFGRPGAWTVRISREDGPPIEVTATAGDQGWADFLRAVLSHANQ